MPIEVNRVNRACPQCKNPTIFNTGKGYFCGKCLSDLNLNQIAEKILA
jgi:ribosomal protein S27AE